MEFAIRFKPLIRCMQSTAVTWGTENTYELFYIGDENNSTIATKDTYNWYVSSHLLNVTTSGRQGTETK